MAQPAVADVRVTCPACGGAIHPIAGRCKHCKTDLVAARGGATGAIGSVIELGSLATAPTANPAPPPLPDGPHGRTGGHGGEGSSYAGDAGGHGQGLPAPVASAAAHVVFAPPPTAPARVGWARRWPLLVAIIAAIAIVASVAVLVFGDHGDKPRRKRVLGPAPDRMQTDQLPGDPDTGPDRSQLQPMPGPAVPDIGPGAPAPDGQFGADPGGVPGGAPGGVPGGPAAGGAVTSIDEFVASAVDVACARLTTCWGSTDAGATCGQLRGLAAAAPSWSALCRQFDPNAAGTCLAQLAAMPCPDAGVGLDDLTTMAAGLDACMNTCGG